VGGPGVPRDEDLGRGGGLYTLSTRVLSVSTQCMRSVYASTQLTHSLKAPGFNPCTLNVISWFQSLLSKFSLCRYSESNQRSLHKFVRAFDTSLNALVLPVLQGANGLVGLADLPSERGGAGDCFPVVYPVHEHTLNLVEPS
jgi:hypothetical protein